MDCPDSCGAQQSATGARRRTQSGQANQSRFGYPAQQASQSGYGSQPSQARQPGFGHPPQSQTGQARQPGYGYQPQSQPSPARQPQPQPGQSRLSRYGYQAQSQPGQVRDPWYGYQAPTQPSQSGFGYQEQPECGAECQARAVPQTAAPVAQWDSTEEAAKPVEKPKTQPKKAADKKAATFQLPALSIVGVKKEINFEEIRKKVIRRGAPAGEDKKQMAKILKHLRDTKPKIMVQEFVGLIAKFTSDNGEVMRKVMEEDLASFRKMVTKVYENMTQDVSDVLLNEQIQTAEFYQERHDIYNNKMLWMISEIFQMIPDFDFEKYDKDKEEFLKHVCPIPQLTIRDAEDMESQRRQEAFHRLQWLKIEEGRLAEENKRLEMRLEELKTQHTKEQTESNMKSHIMEGRLQVLEIEEQEKEKQLKELENMLGKNIVRTEAFIRLEEDEAIRMTKVPTEEKRKSSSPIRHEKSHWSSRTAVAIEQQAADQLHAAESSRARERKRSRKRERESYKSSSLFGGPAQGDDLADLATASNLQEKIIQQTMTTVQERRPKSPRSRMCPGQCQ